MIKNDILIVLVLTFDFYDEKDHNVIILLILYFKFSKLKINNFILTINTFKTEANLTNQKYFSQNSETET